MLVCFPHLDRTLTMLRRFWRMGSLESRIVAKFAMKTACIACPRLRRDSASRHIFSRGQWRGAIIQILFFMTRAPCCHGARAVVRRRARTRSLGKQCTAALPERFVGLAGRDGYVYGANEHCGIAFGGAAPLAARPAFATEAGADPVTIDRRRVLGIQLPTRQGKAITSASTIASPVAQTAVFTTVVGGSASDGGDTLYAPCLPPLPPFGPRQAAPRAPPMITQHRKAPRDAARASARVPLRCVQAQ
jgi:hypothetical protein